MPTGVPRSSAGVAPVQDGLLKKPHPAKRGSSKRARVVDDGGEKGGLSRQCPNVLGLRCTLIAYLRFALISCVCFSLLGFRMGGRGLDSSERGELPGFFRSGRAHFDGDFWRTAGSNHSWSSKLEHSPPSPFLPLPPLSTLTHSHVGAEQPPISRRPKRVHGLHTAALCQRWGPDHWAQCRAALAGTLGISTKGRTMTCPKDCVTFPRHGRFNNQIWWANPKP